MTNKYNIKLDVIENALLKNGIQQNELAKKIGVTPQAVSDWFKRKKNPSPRHLMNISKFLDLKFNEIIAYKEKTPLIINFRLTKNKKLDDKLLNKAVELGNLLQHLYSYIELSNPSKITRLISPQLDFAYIQKVAKVLRDKIGTSSGKIFPKSICDYFQELRSIIIPVFWGEDFPLSNALTIYDPSIEITFVYINIDSKIYDIKFWLLHEISHILSFELPYPKSEEFSDRLAGAILYPEEFTADCYFNVLEFQRVNEKIDFLIEKAEGMGISPVTVFKQINEYVKYYNKLEFGINESTFYSYLSRKDKDSNTVKRLFFKTQPNAEEFIKETTEKFNTQFYIILSKLIKSNKNFDVHYLRRLMDISYEDAVSIYGALMNG